MKLSLHKSAYSMVHVCSFADWDSENVAPKVGINMNLNNVLSGTKRQTKYIYKTLLIFKSWKSSFSGSSTICHGCSMGVCNRLKSLGNSCSHWSLLLNESHCKYIVPGMWHNHNFAVARQFAKSVFMTDKCAFTNVYCMHLNRAPGLSNFSCLWPLRYGPIKGHFTKMLFSDW